MNRPGTFGNVIRVPCTACDGQGCPDCKRWGYTVLTDCPRKVIPADVWHFVRLADFWKKHGVPPIGGGALDQAAQFNAACDYLWRQESYCRAKQGLPSE